MAEQDQGTRWYLAQLKPNGAKTAQRNLERQGFATFLPLEEETRARAGRFVTATRPLFPGYLFVSFDPARGLWRAVNSTQGVARLVSAGKAPAPVPMGLVDGLKRRCDTEGVLQPPAALEAGKRVAVTKGPFAAFLGEVETIEPDRRVWVLLDIMGGTTRVALDRGQLRAV